MEEKLAKLIITAKEVSEKSDKYYVEVSYDGYFKSLKVAVRQKENHEFVEDRSFYNMEDLNVDELIKTIEKYEED